MVDESKKIRNRVNRKVSSSEKQVEAFINRLEGFVGGNIQKILEDIKVGKSKGQEVTSILGSLFTELDRLGLQKEISKIRELYADELQFIQDEFEEQDREQVFSSSDTGLIEALIDNGVEKVAIVTKEMGLNIQATVMHTVLTGEEVSKADILKAKLPASVYTEINTALMVFNRTVTANKADELGFDLYLYVGPDDKITRPFCKDLLDKNPAIYTREEISGMRNDQTADVMTTGGGYNCRHHWRPISIESARTMGYDN